MPTCRNMTELSTDYLEGALPLRQWFGARRHLFACPMCRRYYDQLRKTTRLLRGRALGVAAEVEEAMVEAIRPGPDR